MAKKELKWMPLLGQYCELAALGVTLSTELMMSDNLGCSLGQP